MGADAMAAGAETQRVGPDRDQDVDLPVTGDAAAALARIRAAFDPQLLGAAGHRLVEQLTSHVRSLQAGEGEVLHWTDPSELVDAASASLQYDCTFSEASTRVDGLAGVAGTYDSIVGYEGRYGRVFLLEHEPELWEMLWGTVGLHPELRVRLLHGDADTAPPPENSAAFEALLADAGHDVELIEFAGGHEVPQDLVTETVMELIS